jgi:hypothetical protein
MISVLNVNLNNLLEIKSKRVRRKAFKDVLEPLDLSMVQFI